MPIRDWRGWGRSHCEPRYRKASYFAEDILAVMDETGVERAAIVCQPMGGWTGMRFALANPERVSCIVLSCSPAGVQTPAFIKAMQVPLSGHPNSTQGPILWDEPHVALAAGAFDRIPDKAFLFRQVSSLDPLVIFLLLYAVPLGAKLKPALLPRAAMVPGATQ